jgi:response regulator RpfG family c-di-GMP phosphodiesterase
VRLLEIVLEQAGYTNVFSTVDPYRALSLCAELQPDLLLLDLHMPTLDGFELMQIMQADPMFQAVPILVLTADGTLPIRHRALAQGARDFLIKPLDEVEILLRIRNLLEARFRSELLEAKVRESARFMASTFDALTAHVAVLDQNGTILAVNRAWTKFSEANGGDSAACGVGANYLDNCEQASGCGMEQGWEVHQGIRQVMGGTFPEFHMDYTCDSLVEPRWFTVHVTPFVGGGPTRVVVAHENITERKRIELEMEKTQWETVQRLARAAEFRDDMTGLHGRHVGSIAASIAQAMGLPSEQAALIGKAAPLHDVGKIGVPDAILRKPGRLTVEEFVLMQQHTHIGGQILSGSSSPILQLAEEIARTHHERWDGTGYEGLRGEAIPLSGRIVSVADVFDVLTHERPYKAAWSMADALAEIQAQSGRQFDPEVVTAFLTLPHHELL